MGTIVCPRKLASNHSGLGIADPCHFIVPASTDVEVPNGKLLSSILLPQFSEFYLRKLKGKAVFLISLRQILISNDLRNNFEAATLKKNFLKSIYEPFFVNIKQIQGKLRKYLGI